MRATRLLLRLNCLSVRPIAVLLALIVHGSLATELFCQTGSYFDSPEVNRLRAANTSWRLSNHLWQVQETDVDAATIDALEKRLQDDAQMDSARRTELEETVAGLRESLARYQQFRSEATTWEQNAATAAEQATQIRRQTEQLAAPDTAGLAAMNSAQLDALLAEISSQINELTTQLNAATEEPARRDRRRSEITARLAELDRELAALAAEPQPRDPATITELDAALDSAGQLLERQLKEAEQAQLRNELAAWEAQAAAQLLVARRDNIARQLALAREHEEQVRNELVVRRREESRQALEQARDEALAALPLLRAIADENAAIAEQGNRLVEPTANALNELKRREQQLVDLQSRFDTSSRRVADIGLTDSVGALLREQKAMLTEMRFARPEARGMPLSIEEVQFELYELDDRRAEASTDDAVIGDVLREISRLPEAEQERYRLAAEMVAERRREYLDQAIVNFRAYRDALVELERIDRRRAELVREFRDYINERILWIRSNKPLYRSIEVDAGDRRLLDLNLIGKAVSLLQRDFLRDMTLYLLVFGLFAGLVAVRPRLRAKIDELGEIAARGSCCQYWPTGRALILTLFVSLPVPLVTLFAGWRLTAIEHVANGTSNEMLDMARSLGLALLNVGWFVLPVAFLRVAARKNGLAAAHLGWKTAGMVMLRRHLRWAIPVGCALTFALSFVYHSDATHRNDLVERLLMITAMVALAVLLGRLFHPQNGVLANAISRRQSAWVSQAGFLWYRMVVAVPLVFAVLTFLGWYYTALVLVTRAWATIVLLLLLFLVHGMLARLILVRRRFVLIDQARQRRDQARAAAERDEEQAGTVEAITASLNQSLARLDVDENALQGNRLLTLAAIILAITGTWMIWVEVLPAARMLDEYKIWSAPAVAAETTEKATESEDAAGSPAGEGTAATVLEQAASTFGGTSDDSTAITVRDLLLALIFALITIVTARNLPSLLEILFLKQLPVDQSVRHAFKALTSYFIVLLGVILTFGALSIGWTHVQWLATALTFGLAFGLQEIFANFVAGIILLFERPVRIGDVITVDDITGVVSRIRTRATTLVAWDHREYVIPNKEFITGRTLNWTLTNKVTRLSIEVGVAYGSDVDRAKEIMLETCRENPLIIDEPRSTVTFEGFGDNALRLVLRTFIRDVDTRWQAIDQLHSAINTAFHNAGIEIAFPQRDLHLRSVDPKLLERLGGPGNSGNAAA